MFGGATRGRGGADVGHAAAAVELNDVALVTAIQTNLDT